MTVKSITVLYTESRVNMPFGDNNSDNLKQNFHSLELAIQIIFVYSLALRISILIALKSLNQIVIVQISTHHLFKSRSEHLPRCLKCHVFFLILHSKYSSLSNVTDKLCQLYESLGILTKGRQKWILPI